MLGTYRTHCLLCPSKEYSLVLPGTYLHLSQVKHVRLKCLTQGTNNETSYISLKTCPKRALSPDDKQRNYYKAPCSNHCATSHCILNDYKDSLFYTECVVTDNQNGALAQCCFTMLRQRSRHCLGESLLLCFTSVLGLRPPGLEFRILCGGHHSSHHPQEVLLAQFSLYVHKSGLEPDSFHFIFFIIVRDGKILHSLNE